MTKANMQRQDTRYVALLLALAILMLLVPRVSAAEYTDSGATKFVLTESLPSPRAITPAIRLRERS